MKTYDPKSKREQRLLFLLPSAAVLVVYAFLIALPKQQQLSELTSTYTNNKRIAVDQQLAEQARQNLIVAKESLNRMRNRLASDRLNMKQTSQNWRSPEERLETIQLLTEMLDTYGLSMVTQNYELEPNISTYFRDLTDKINKESPSAPPLEFWKIKMEGSYADMQTFLDAIDMELMKTFPVTLSMVPSENGTGSPIWTVIFVV